MPGKGCQTGTAGAHRLVRCPHLQSMGTAAHEVAYWGFTCFSRHTPCASVDTNPLNTVGRDGERNCHMPINFPSTRRIACAQHAWECSFHDLRHALQLVSHLQLTTLCSSCIVHACSCTDHHLHSAECHCFYLTSSSLCRSSPRMPCPPLHTQRSGRHRGSPMGLEALAKPLGMACAETAQCPGCPSCPSISKEPVSLVCFAGTDTAELSSRTQHKLSIQRTGPMRARDNIATALIWLDGSHDCSCQSSLSDFELQPGLHVMHSFLACRESIWLPDSWLLEACIAACSWDSCGAVTTRSVASDVQVQLVCKYTGCCCLESAAAAAAAVWPD